MKAIRFKSPNSPNGGVRVQMRGATQRKGRPTSRGLIFCMATRKRRGSLTSWCSTNTLCRDGRRGTLPEQPHERSSSETAKERVKFVVEMDIKKAGFNERRRNATVHILSNPNSTKLEKIITNDHPLDHFQLSPDQVLGKEGGNAGLEASVLPQA